MAIAVTVIPGGSAVAASPYTGDSIRNLHSGLCLEIADWSQNNGGVARQWSCTGNPNQQWQLSGSQIKNVYSGLCLEIADWSQNNGAIARQWSCTGNPNQHWNFGNYANPNSGYDSLLPWVAANINSSKCLEIGGWGTNWGDGADQWSCTGQPNQAWGWGSAKFWG